MALKTLIVKNSSGSSQIIKDRGITVANGGQEAYITLEDIREMLTSEDLRVLAKAGTLVLNDGTSDVPASHVDDFIQYHDTGREGGTRSTNRILLTFGDQVSAGVQQTGTGWLSVRYFTFQGTVYSGSALSFRSVANRASGGGDGEIRVRDITNGNTVVSILSPNGVKAASPTIYSATPGNLPASEALFVLEIRGSNAGTKITCHSIEFF